MTQIRCVQYGCGLSAPKSWVNYDASPTLRIQLLPIAGIFLKPFLNVQFPPNVRYGDIVKGLPEKDDSVDAIYCSHVLEHLALEDFRKALKNTYRLLKPGGVFRLVMPDLNQIIQCYLNDIEQDKFNAAEIMIRNTGMGSEQRPKGIKGNLSAALGNSKHLWLWDERATLLELEQAGFSNMRICKFGDSHISAFSDVEDESRFIGALAIEAHKRPNG